LFVVVSLLFVVVSLLFVVVSLLFVVVSLLFVVVSLLFVVVSLLFVVIDDKTMATSKVEERLKELGVEFKDAPPAPVASYVAYVQTGNLLFISGQLPKKDGALIHNGIVGDGVEMEQAQEAAKWCAINGLHQAKVALGSLDRITRVVKVGGFVRCGPNYTDQPKVINGASDFLAAALGPEIGQHARAAVGVSSLPMGVCVEVDFIFEVK